MACVQAGVDRGIPVAIRGGGHNAGGLGICDDGLVIDLALIEPRAGGRASRTPCASAAARSGATSTTPRTQFGLAVPSGIISTTGVGGLSLGGGIGHLTRKCGLTIDNILGARDGAGRRRNVDGRARQHNADLFWALRGGGGNFGVVTAFTFRAHDIHTDYAGPMLWPLDRAKEIMQWYREFLPAHPMSSTASSPS